MSRRKQGRYAGRGGKTCQNERRRKVLQEETSSRSTLQLRSEWQVSTVYCKRSHHLSQVGLGDVAQLIVKNRLACQFGILGAEDQDALAGQQERIEI